MGALRGCRRLTWWRCGFAVACLALAVWPSLASAQCAMCRTALLSPEGQRLAGGFRSGILLLLAAPFAIFGTVAYLAVRRQRLREAGDRPMSRP